VWETITEWPGWDGLSIGGAWFVTSGLLLIGLIGCFVPIIPGHLMIFLAAVAHRVLLGWVLERDSGVEWWTFVILGALLAIGQAFDILSGAVGSKWFGGTKWGAAGAIVGGIVGMFFMPFGLVLGPLLGAYGFESLFAKQETRPAMVSGVGSAVGTLANLVVKVILGFVMVLWFFIDVWFVG
jgi:uncharacterized protein YqgC (DUF456 family)